MIHSCFSFLLLFFHHVPYTYRLHSGKTVIQHIYDAHYEGAEKARGYVRVWESLQGLITDDEVYEFVLNRLKYQAGHAIVWRDAVCNWFLRTSGIPDRRRRRQGEKRLLAKLRGKRAARVSASRERPGHTNSTSSISIRTMARPSSGYSSATAK